MPNGPRKAPCGPGPAHLPLQPLVEVRLPPSVHSSQIVTFFAELLVLLPHAHKLYPLPGVLLLLSCLLTPGPFLISAPHLFLTEVLGLGQLLCFVLSENMLLSFSTHFSLQFLTHLCD